MSRVTKNKKTINARYFLNENEEWEAKHGANMEPRITTGMGSVPGLKDGARGNSIIVDRGRQRSDGAYQIHVLPKAVGLYDSFYSAVMSGMSGERYYMTDEEIEAGTMPDSVRPGQFSQSRGSFSYSMNESKQPTTKTLMEGFGKFLNESNYEEIENILNTETFQGKLSGGVKAALYPHLTSGMLSGPESTATAMEMIRAMAERGFYYDDREKYNAGGGKEVVGKVALTDGELFALSDVYKKLGGTGSLKLDNRPEDKRMNAVEIEKFQKSAIVHRDKANQAAADRDRERNKHHGEMFKYFLQKIKELGGDRSFLAEEKEK